jgi:predicted nucleic acid-binding protein
MASVAGSGVKRLIRALRLRRLLTQFPHLSLAPMDVGVARQAALLRGASNVPMADAIHVATAQQAGAGAIVTNDYAWRAWVARPKLVLLGDYA